MSFLGSNSQPGQNNLVLSVLRLGGNEWLGDLGAMSDMGTAQEPCTVGTASAAPTSYAPPATAVIADAAVPESDDALFMSGEDIEAIVQRVVSNATAAAAYKVACRVASALARPAAAHSREIG